MTSANTRKNVLFITRWYPNRYDPMPGLFIQRHAEAVALYHQASVLYLQPKLKDDSSNTTDYEFTTNNNVHTLRVYYHNPSLQLPLITAAIKFFNFFYYSHLGFGMISQKSGKFDLVHVNILTRMGILALLLKTRYGIPYIITEHWSRYLPITGTYKGVIRKFLTRLVVKNASAVTTVTLNLAHAMQAHQLKHNNYQVINNVANTDLFTPNIKAGSALKNILHVSCFEDRSKNLSGLLRAIKRLSQDRKDFKVAMVGDGQDFALIKTYAAELGIPNDQIEFTGLLENQELIEVFRGSHFMVMFSNYENMPVVINEAMCCGLPVVATQVGGIPEIVSNKFGILVKARDENALVTSLHRMLDTYTLYNSDEIRDFAIKNFSVQSIGKKFSDIYLDILHDKK